MLDVCVVNATMLSSVGAYSSRILPLSLFMQFQGLCLHSCIFLNSLSVERPSSRKTMTLDSAVSGSSSWADIQIEISLLPHWFHKQGLMAISIHIRGLWGVSLYNAKWLSRGLNWWGRPRNKIVFQANDHSYHTWHTNVRQHRVMLTCQTSSTPDLQHDLTRHYRML